MIYRGLFQQTKEQTNKQTCIHDVLGGRAVWRQKKKKGTTSKKKHRTCCVGKAEGQQR